MQTCKKNGIKYLEMKTKVKKQKKVKITTQVALENVIQLATERTAQLESLNNENEDFFKAFRSLEIINNLNKDLFLK